MPTRERRTLIADEWRRFSSAVLSPTASEIRRTEMRRAFYAGASTLFSAVITKLSPGSETQASDIDMLEDLLAEFEGFARKLGGGSV